MAEKSEYEASKTGQDTESPETQAHESKDAERGADAVSAADQERQPESQGAVAAEADRDPSVDAAGNPYPTNPEQPRPYSESDDFVADPTAMTGTLETSGTGGGVHESVKGTTEVFSGLPTTLEVHGLALHRNEIISGDATGQPEPHRGADANVATTEDKATDEQREEAEKNRPAADADGVSAGAAGVAQPQSTSYSENVIAGAADPNQRTGESEGSATTARKAGETPESEATEGEQSEGEGSTTAKKTAAKKTTARKTTASKSATDK